tara:strand:+ start:178 stop:1545 length:1368 start_codon:yes stop_codon:yes gene_type:complete
MKSLKTWMLLNEASADATTFFHEVLCGIACFDPAGAASVKKGADILPFFTNKSIVAKDSGLNDITPSPSEKWYKFIDDTVVQTPPGEDPSTEIQSKEASEEYWKDNSIDARKRDAINVANAIVKRIGKPNGTVYWTGPTNDATHFGAADIAYNEQGISLKFGEGQFKNLTVNQFARAALGTGKEVELLTELHTNVPEKWDNMTFSWLSLLDKSLMAWDVSKFRTKTGSKRTRAEALSRAKELFKGWKPQTQTDWGSYQKLRVKDSDVQVFHDLLYVPGKKSVYDKDDKKGERNRVKQFRYICRKLYDQGPAHIRKTWKTQRNDLFTSIFGEYFKKKDAIIKDNLHVVFERQISVGEKPMIYAAEGGKSIKRVPSKAEFDNAIQTISFSYEGKTTGAGYTFILLAQQDPADPKEKIMEITIYFRWKAGGQMVGNPDTSSESEMYIKDYTEVFKELR